MTALFIDAAGKHWHRDIPADLVSYGVFKEGIAPAFVAFLDLRDEALSPASFKVRRWQRQSYTYGGTPIFVDSEGPWEVKELYALDICADHPDHLAHSERLVREKAYRLMDSRPGSSPIDKQQRVRPFSLSQRLKEVEFRMLVQVRKS